MGAKPSVCCAMTSTHLHRAGSPPSPLAPACGQADVPQPSAANLVTALARQWNGHDCLAVELTDAEQGLRLQPQAAATGRASRSCIAPSPTA